MKILSHSHILQLPDSLSQRQPTLSFSSRDFKANICLHLCVYMYSFSSIQIVAQHMWYLGILNFYLNNMSWDHPAYYIPSSFFFFFWQSCAAWKILVPWPEIEAVHHAMEAWSPYHWTARGFLITLFNSSIVLLCINYHNSISILLINSFVVSNLLLLQIMLW